MGFSRAHLKPSVISPVVLYVVGVISKFHCTSTVQSITFLKQESARPVVLYLPMHVCGSHHCIRTYFPITSRDISLGVQ